MIAVGIDIAKDKHDCFIMNSDGEILFDVFTIRNNRAGFDELFSKIKSASRDLSKVKVGLEATGHYSCNLLRFLKDKGLTTYVLNPLYTSQCRKSISLRKTKTDKIDARTIAGIVLSDVSLKPYSDTLYHKTELKSLSRYRFERVNERTKLKQSISRLVTILFPELEELVSSLHGKAVYTLLTECPGASYIAECNLKHLTCLLSKASKGHFKAERASLIRETARNSIGTVSYAKSLELKHTIRRILDINTEIEEIETQIKSLMLSSLKMSTPVQWNLPNIFGEKVSGENHFSKGSLLTDYPLLKLSRSQHNIVSVFPSETARHLSCKSVLNCNN